MIKFDIIPNAVQAIQQLAPQGAKIYAMSRIDMVEPGSYSFIRSVTKRALADSEGFSEIEIDGMHIGQQAGPWLIVFGSY